MTCARRILLTTSLTLAAVPVAFAAEPESGTISSASPKVEWNGTSGGYGITAANILINAAGEQMVCEAPFCDTFTLEVADGGVDMTLALTSEQSTITTAEVEKPDGSWEYQNGIEPEGTEADYTTRFRFKKAMKGTWIVRTMSNANAGLDPYVGVAQLLVPAAAPAPVAGAPAAAPAPDAAPAADSAPAAPPSLTIAAAGKLSARKLNRARSLTARVESTGTVRGVKAFLSSGKKIVGKGSLSSLSGKSKVKLKLGRKLKPGRYTLAVAGRSSSGATVPAGVKVKIRR